MLYELYEKFENKSQIQSAKIPCAGQYKPKLLKLPERNFKCPEQSEAVEPLAS